MANSNNNSDYNKPHLDLYNSLPEYLQTDTSRAVFSNLFDRYLTKQEIKRVAGYIGEGNPNAIQPRQIREPTVHRQAFQLQPVLHTKIGSIDHLTSWDDIQHELTRLGVDMEQFADWGKTIQYNWIPPVDIDKIIHYQDYYWFNEENPNSKPEYITIRSRCTTAIANANFWQTLNDEFGGTIDIKQLLPVDDFTPYPSFNIVSVLAGINTITVSGDVTNQLSNGDFFSLNGTPNSDGVYQLIATPNYDGISESTLLVAPGSFIVNDGPAGTLNQRKFDKIVLDGEYIRLFDPGFVFFFRESTNMELNDAFWEVVSSEYDETMNETIIRINTTVTDVNDTGVISLEEQLNFYLAERDCQCTGSVGWDLLLWDDNIDNPLWDNPPGSASDPINHQTLIALISQIGPPSGAPGAVPLWYDTVADIVYQYQDTPDFVGWKVLWNKFSKLLAKTEGFALWDFTPGCGIMSVVPSATQWTDTNFWLHKNDVPSFSVAKQAQFPIIEYDWDLELNEWTFAESIWKYRKDRFETFEISSQAPNLIELQPLDLWEHDGPNEEVVFDERYGDMTNAFNPGDNFQSSGILAVFEVVSSSYKANIIGEPYQTRVKITVPISTSGLIGGVLSTGTPSATPLRPYRTTHGDAWRLYGDHWLYCGQKDTVPVIHQPSNPEALISQTSIPQSDPFGYDYIQTYATEQFAITATATLDTFEFHTVSHVGSTRPLNRRALSGYDDIRVYINDIREYGSYDELVDVVGGISYVRGIKFFPGFTPVQFDTVRIEVGEAAISGIGNFQVPVRTIVDNMQYAIDGNETVSIIEYRLVEQVKSKVNQYPLFDVYNSDGTQALRANPIFGYKTSSDAPVNATLGLRMVADFDQRIFSFDQFLLDEDDGEVFAFRDYANVTYDFWFNNRTRELFFWDGLQWSDKTIMGTYYRKAVVSNIEPGLAEQSISGLYWYDTLSMQLFIRNTVSGTWDMVGNVDVRTTDSTIQSIWRHGLNKEEYIPQKVDWVKRSLVEYTAERNLFVTERAQDIALADSSLTEAEATVLADAEWLLTQVNEHSATGEWVGAWEIPDPLYYNHLHENRKCITSRELLTHFNTIIQAQPKIPGFNGPRESMFHLIATGDVNYGLGGTIHEYADTFDMLLSSVFVNNVTPRTLIEYGHDQYESALNNILELYNKNAIDYLTNVTTAAIFDFSDFVTTELIFAHESSDFLSAVYGDSTVFNNDTGLGIRNWIVTLPYMEIIRKHYPERLIDINNGINQVVHHDGHRKNYFLQDVERESIIRSVLDVPDERTSFPTPEDPPLDTFGRLSAVVPPNNIAEFALNFNTSVLGREGVYWYHVDAGISTLYRLVVAESGPDEPSSALDDGSLWLDLTTGFEVLRNKVTDPITNTVSWVPAFGLSIGDGRLHNGTDVSDVTTATISAWKPIDLDVALGDAIYNIEQKVYENAPDPVLLRYAIDDIRSLNPVAYDSHLLDVFNNFVTQSEISTPLINLDFNSTDPFTWNYKFSTPGVGLQILAADQNTNTFIVEGDFVTLFDPCTAVNSCPSQVGFFVKNSAGNDGTWTTAVSTIGFPIAVYDTLNDVTIVQALEPITDDQVGTGVIYTGLLPSSINNGSESGGDWRDYYQKLYGTPYPHLEPWGLQGYTEQPLWWNDRYINDDKNQWGDRTWKYKHGFGVVGIDIVDDGFFIDGDFRYVFLNNQSIVLDQTPGSVYDSTFTTANISVVNSVVTGAAGTASIILPGNLGATLAVGSKFATTDTVGNLTGLFTVKQFIFTGPPGFESIVTVEEEITSIIGIDNIAGSTYDPVANQTKVRVVNDLTVSVVGGRILLRHGMWEQIRVGVIPAGELYSNGIRSITGNPIQDNAIYGLRTPSIPTYNYFSVNIDNVDIVDGNGTVYSSDAVFPPLFDPTVHYTTSISLFDIMVRSVFQNFGAEIVLPSANYSFGDVGPVEWEWRESSQYLYDQLTIAYRLDPVRFICKTFGIDTNEVTCLPIDTITKQPVSHNRINFHGDILNNEVYLINGTNQWYTNFNRFHGYDASFADFRNLWTRWTAPLTYQFATFVDTPSLDIAHRYIDLSEFDYDILAKRAPGVDDFWYDVFDVHVTTIPPALQRYDNQLDWGLEIDTNLPQSRTIQYYDVRNYQFYSNPTTGVSTLFTWEVESVDVFNKTFSVSGNQTQLFKVDSIFIVSDSTANDNTYQVVDSVFDRLSNTTILTLDAPIVSIVADGTITLASRTLPWQTGDIVYLSTAETLPSPLLERTSGGLIPYFIIVDDSINFRLALSSVDASTGTSVPIFTSGRRDHFVGEIRSTFISNGATKTNTLWKHYELDLENIVTFTTPYPIQGMQTLVDIIDGYDVFTYNQGWRINEDNRAVDPDTSRILGWQVELERFIDYAFGLRVLSYQNVNKYFVSVDVGSSGWTFIDPEIKWITGDEVNVFSSNGIYPAPLIRNMTYYVIRDSDTTFRLASSKFEAANSNPIVITSDAGIGDLQLGSVRSKDFSRHQEINPTRGAIWFRPERGIVSNVIDGPSPDIRTSNLIFDQNGDPIEESNLRVFREDKVTKLSIIEDRNHLVNINDISPYTFLHFGGMHLFLDAYEHVLQFNNYTSENELIYDPFIGLNVTKYEMLFNRQVEFNERPNLGGYYMHTFFNQGADLRRNLEASVEDIRTIYDTHTVLESTDITKTARNSLGYTGTREYLDNLNLHEKSQFLFWRGAIQAKGSVKSIQAFVNSRRFIDAKIDDYWAYKLADFGSAAEREYPEIYITTDDAKSNDIRLQFVDDSDFCFPGFEVDPFDKDGCGYAFPDSGDPVLLGDLSFTPIRITDDDRWFNQPDQVQILRDNGLNLHFTLKPSDKTDVFVSDWTVNTNVLPPS